MQWVWTVVVSVLPALNLLAFALQADLCEV